MGPTTAFTDSELVHVSFTRGWALLTDWDAAPGWMPGVTHMYAEGPTELGVLIGFTAAGHERSVTVTALEPGRSLTLTAGEGDVRTDYRYDVEADGDDVRISLTIDVVVSAELEEMGGEIREAVAEAESSQLQRFKRFAEAAP